mmetsp:Transcript_18262/g.17386  ORF Transcript_18262/g.17386 Transcript_18262/m.17386 type:complete len:118 (+) Transcript_18262:204-557(+)
MLDGFQGLTDLQFRLLVHISSERNLQIGFELLLELLWIHERGLLEVPRPLHSFVGKERRHLLVLGGVNREGRLISNCGQDAIVDGGLGPFLLAEPVGVNIIERIEQGAHSRFLFFEV